MKVQVHEWKVDADVVDLVLQGDPHTGANTFLEDRLKADIDFWCKKGCHVINMGDACETATKDSVGAGVIEQSEDVDRQLEHYLELIQPLVDKGLFVGSHMGNHEYRVYKHSGFNIAKQISRSTGTPYFGEGVVHYIRVGKENYIMYTTHGGSGARLPHTKIKACIDLEKMVSADVYGMGHLHTLSHHVRQFYQLNKRNKTLIRKERHFVITGAYLSHWGSYAQQKGYEPAKIGSARIRLYGDQELIKVTA